MKKLPVTKQKKLTSRQKAVLTRAVKKTVKDYGETLKLLAQE